MNIVYGGSFNPPTIAHQSIVSKLKEKFNPNNIIIVPAYSNYTWKNLVNYEERLEMAKIAFPSCIISNVESLSDEYKGTYNTLNILSKEFSDLYFCMGADNLKEIKKWINYEKLLEDYHFIVFNREGYNLEEFIDNNLKEYKSKFQIVDFDLDISASMYRNEYKKEVLDEKIYDYIISHNLYGNLR